MERMLTKKHMTYALGKGALPSEPLYLRTEPLKSKSRKRFTDLLFSDISSLFEKRDRRIKRKI